MRLDNALADVDQAALERNYYRQYLDPVEDKDLAGAGDLA